MKIIDLGFKSLTKFSAVVLVGVVSCACNSSENDSNSSQAESSNTTLTSLQTELTVLQNQVGKLQESVVALQTVNNALETELSSDEIKLKKISLLGHLPGTNSLYGPCNDMGVLVGSNQVDSLTATTEDFRQCTGYEYGVVVENGTIAKPFALWFDGINCTGNMFEAENDGGYNRQVLENGVVFISPIDNITELMVASNQVSQSTTLLSNFSGGVCSTASEIQNSYLVIPNDVDLTGVPSAFPANFSLQ